MPSRRWRYWRRARGRPRRERTSSRRSNSRPGRARPGALRSSIDNRWPGNLIDIRQTRDGTAQRGRSPDSLVLLIRIKAEAALCLGHHRAGLLAGNVHRHGGSREGIPLQPVDRLPRPCASQLRASRAPSRAPRCAPLQHHRACCTQSRPGFPGMSLIDQLDCSRTTGSGRRTRCKRLTGGSGR